MTIDNVTTRRITATDGHQLTQADAKTPADRRTFARVIWLARVQSPDEYTEWTDAEVEQWLADNAPEEEPADEGDAPAAPTPAEL